MHDDDEDEEGEMLFHMLVILFGLASGFVISLLLGKLKEYIEAQAAADARNINLPKIPSEVNTGRKKKKKKKATQNWMSRLSSNKFFSRFTHRLKPRTQTSKSETSIES